MKKLLFLIAVMAVSFAVSSCTSKAKPAEDVLVDDVVIEQTDVIVVDSVEAEAPAEATEE
jgi:hypothetical protein